MKWPFRRNKSILPSEVEDYYKAEKRDRAGTVWFLAFGTLLVTVVLALGVFFGARWAYRKFAGTEVKPKPPVATGSQPGKITSSATGPSDAAVGSTLQGSQPPAAAEPTPPTASTPIPRTGPADTLAIFVAVSALGAFGHRTYTSRKINSFK